MARGVDGMGIFLDDGDYRKFLGNLNRLAGEMGMTIYAYCLMPNHFHLAIKVSTFPLGSFMHRILTGHALTFNQRYAREGHLFQARHRAKLCLSDRYLLALIHYIQMNPVRAKLVTKPEDWPWSSRTPMQLPDLDSGSFDPWPTEEAGPALIRPEPREESTLEEITGKIASMTGIGLGSMRSKSKSPLIVNARRCLAREGVRRGHRISSIAAWLNLPLPSVSFYLRENSTNC
ncbi:MAG: transposase [Elusimicrobia bacterium]|nr:transposase [Elusimicrobiota bacterium]